MAEEKTGSMQYGVKKFVYVGGTLAILVSVVAIALKLSAGTTSGLFFPLTTMVLAVIFILLARFNSNAK
ncbi:hypothetical protein AABM36_04205 [Kocuria sp. KSNUG]|uniref:hypothetical protein n=1 Tax=Kocuria TaxID=57493 RepID=UPI0038794B7D